MVTLAALRKRLGECFLAFFDDGQINRFGRRFLRQSVFRPQVHKEQLQSGGSGGEVLATFGAELEFHGIPDGARCAECRES